jgi:hypothetical protein
MTWIPLAQRISGLPDLLAGPILRRTEPRSVTVWVAMRVPCTVTLEIYDATIPSSLGHPLFSGSANTVKLGVNLNVVAVSANTVTPTPALQTGTCYCYDLQFVGASSTKRLRDFTADLAYAPFTLPSFALPPDDLNQVRLVHGSCRKPHGEGFDALPALDAMIGSTAPDALQRPHQLFLTGDQIYADDVADVLLSLLTEAGDTLLGWEETLPVVNQPAKGLKPGKRSEIADRKAGLTSGLGGAPELAKSHLFGLGEYYSMYLFAWSEVLWPNALPTFSDVFSMPESFKTTIYSVPQTVQSPLAARFRAESEAIGRFLLTLPRVRKALANVPTYMIFDDHDVTDDWNLNLSWCRRTMGNDLGRRIVQNALAAYAVFQAWGNTPAQFEGTAPGSAFLSALAQWRGKADLTDEEVKRRLRVPAAADIELTHGLPVAPDGLTWHYTAEGPRYKVVVLDARTHRKYAQGADDPPFLLDDAALQQQIPPAPTSSTQVTLVVAPAPVAGFSLVEAIQELMVAIGKTRAEGILEADFEAWIFQRHAFESLLARLASHDPVVLLSGDVHYGFSFRIEYWITAGYGVIPPAHPTGGVFAQLTASAQKNEDVKTRAVHSAGFAPVAQWLLTTADPAPLQYLGWNNAGGGTRKVGTKTDIGPPSIIRIPVGPTVDMQVSGSPGVLLLNQERWDGTKLALTQQPDWAGRVDFVRAERRDQSSSSPTPAVGNTPPTSDRVQQLSAYLGVSAQHRRFLKEGSGMEVVGKNNLGEISFAWGSTHSVVHELWWRVEGDDHAVVEPLPLTKFVVSLDHGQSRYPRPEVP